MAEEKKKKTSKLQGSVVTAVVHVKATFNNTIVSVADLNGNVIAWSSAGKLGYKGSKKSTAYVAQLIAADAMKKAMVYGVKKAEVYIKGPGLGRDSAVRGIEAEGIEIFSLRDVTPVPHNGCRPPKKRRV